MFNYLIAYIKNKLINYVLFRYFVDSCSHRFRVIKTTLPLHFEMCEHSDPVFVFS